jgi:hypothetical protein
LRPTLDRPLSHGLGYSLAWAAEPPGSWGAPAFEPGRQPLDSNRQSENPPEMIGRGALCCFLLASLLGCKVVDELKERLGSDPGAEGATSASAAPPAGAPGPSATNNVVAVSGKFTPLPLRVGQWVRYADKTGQGGFTYSVVGKERDAYQLEVVSPTKVGDTVTQVLLAVNDDRDPNSLKLLQAKVKAPGMPAMTIGEQQADVLGKISKGIIEAVKVPNWDKAPRETVTVEAGTFQGAMRLKSNQEIMGFKSDSVSWHHDSVPITTMIKVEGTFEGKPTYLQLMSYSLTGAKSKL